MSEEFNKDELTHPEWLSIEFLQNVLQSYKKNKDIQVINCNITPASIRGDHYASIIFRVVVDYKLGGEVNSISLIVKALPTEDGPKKDMWAESSIFRTEIDLYTKIIPVVQTRLQSVGIGFKTGAECVYQSLSPRQIIIFTDITEQGFQMKRNECSFEEAFKLAKKLAQWHAATFQLIQENPSMVDSYRNGLFGANLKTEYFDAQLIAFVEVASEWTNNEKYIKNLKDFVVNYKSKLTEVYQSSRDGFNVMCHGDFHCRNLMYKYESDIITDVALLDFQLSFAGSPGVDIIYLLYAIAGDDARTNHREDLISAYYREFTSTLKTLKYCGKIPSLLDLQIEILRCGPLEPFQLFEFVGLFLVDSSKFDLSKLMDPVEGLEVRKAIFNMPAYKEILLRNIPDYCNKGLI